jgi:hypothetical protein
MTQSGANASRGATIVDLLENALGELSTERAGSLSPDELEGLAEVVNAFYDAWDVPVLESDDLRVYSGGWIAGNPQSEDARQYLYTTLLYAPSVVIHDPIAEWFDPDRERLESPPPIRAATGGIEVQGAETQLRRADGYFVFRGEPERSRVYLTQAVRIIAELAPLIRCGIVIPIPQWRLVQRRQGSMLSAVRHDVRDEVLAALIATAVDDPPPRTDQIRGLDVTPSGGVLPSDVIRAVVQNPSYFLAKTLALADATSSRYLPPAAIDAALLDHRLGKLGEELRRKSIDLQVVAGLAAAELPFLGSLDASTIVSIRQSGDVAFADWRAELRNTARTIEASPSDGDVFVTESREVIADALIPRAREVERAVSRSRVMKDAAKDQVANLSVGAAAATGGAAIAGAPLVPAALAGLGISAVGRWAYASLFGPKPQGSRAILASLVKNRKR